MKNRTEYPLNQKGFTLIELLVAGSIISVIFSLIFGVFFNVIKGKERGEKAGEIYQNVRIIFTIMERDIRSAVLLKYTTGKIFKGEDREEGGASMDVLRFTTLASLDLNSSFGGGGQSLVEYKTEYQPEKKQVFLFRNEIPILKEESLDEKNRIILGTDLYGLNLRYLTNDGWKDIWGSDQNQLPQAVEIELTILDSEDERRTFTDIVWIGAGS